MNSIKSDEFFKNIARDAEIADLKLVRDVYYGMIRTISRELRGKHTVKLPDWGEFVLRIHKSRNFISVNGEPGRLPAKPTLKFVPDHKVKKYFYALGNESTVLK